MVAPVLGNLGVARLPQLNVINSVLRTAPLEGGPQSARRMTRYAFRRRLDGGYTIANGAANLHELSPNSFRFLKDFIPALQRVALAPAQGRRPLPAGGRVQGRWTRRAQTVRDGAVDDPLLSGILDAGR